MNELARALNAYIHEVCSTFGTLTVPYRLWTRAVPDTGNSVWTFEDGAPRLDWRHVDRVVAHNVMHDTVPAAEGVRSAVASLGISPPGVPDPPATWVLNDILVPLLYRYLRQMDRVAYDSALAMSVCQEAETELTATPARTIGFITPILNVHIAEENVEFVPGVCLRHATSDEIERWLNWDNAFWSDRPLGRRELSDLKNVVEASTVIPRPGVTNAYEWAQDRTSDVITALRLGVRSDVFAAFIEGQGHGGLRHPSSYMSRMGWKPRHDVLGATAIGADQLAEVCEIFTHVQRNNDQRIKLAMRRWENATDRFSAEDRLIDYWIGLEALFSPSDKQEIRYRVSLRIAAMMGDSPENRTALYREIGHSYDWRSALVHGADSKRIKSLIKKGDLPEVESRAKELLRLIVLRILASPENFDPASLENKLLASNF